MMQIAILLFDGVTALDAIGPYEVLARLPGAELRFVGREVGTVRTDNGFLGLSCDRSIDDLERTEILVVPGGFGTRALLKETSLLEWLRRIHQTTRYTTSVCTGSLVLAAAGLLDDLEATSHWAALDELGALGARPTRQRVVEQGKVITAAGVSAGIDMALHLAAKLVGPEMAQAIQLGIEYDPQPPFDAGSVDKAPPAIVELVRQALARRNRR
ncbi:MAG: DJ-1/PfpI family protein [Myxococcales bacterium]|nr:DJ-1/PfpI family protein [Myxococcales bacterium]